VGGSSAAGPSLQPLQMSVRAAHPAKQRCTAGSTPFTSPGTSRPPSKASDSNPSNSNPHTNQPIWSQTPAEAPVQSQRQQQ